MTKTRKAPGPRWVVMLLLSSALAVVVPTISDAQNRASATGQIDEARTLHQSIRKLLDDQKFEEALPSAIRALAIRESSLPADHPDVAESLIDLGEIYLETREPSKCGPLFERALKIQEKRLGLESSDLVDVLLDLAELYAIKNDFPSGEAALRRVVHIHEKELGPESAEVATSLNTLGLLYLNRNDYVKGEPLFRRALEIREKALGPNHPLYAQSLNNLAALYRDKGDYSRAEPLLKRALDIREKSPGPQQLDLASSLNNAAGLYDLKGDYDRAAELFQRALDIREKAKPDSALVAESLNYVALAYKHKKDYERAEPLYQQALAIRERVLKPDDPNVALSLSNLGVLHMEQGDYAGAQPLLERALKIRQKVLGGNHPVLAQSISNLGTLAFYTRNYTESESLHARALSMFEERLGPAHPTSCLSRNNLAQISVTNHKLARAAALLSRNNDLREKNLVSILNVGSERDRISYLSTLGEETDFTVSFSTLSARRSPQATRLALTRVLRLKGRAIDAMADSIGALARRAAPDDRRVLDQLSTARAQLASLVLRGPGSARPAEHRANIARLEAEVRNLEEQASLRSAQFRAQSKAVTIARVQHAIPAGAALVEIDSYRPFNPQPGAASEVFGAPHYVAYVLKRIGEPRWVDLGEAQVIDTAVESFRVVLRQDGDKPLSDINRSVKPAARMLDERVMRPVRKLLGNASTLFISPDGALNLIPFAALVDENNRFLVQRYSITYLTSGRDLLRLQERTPSREQATIIADPNFGGDVGTSANRSTNAGRAINFADVEFEPLEGTTGEAAALRQILSGATVLTRDQATETAIKQVAGPTVLHVATHGFFLEDVTTSSSATGRGVTAKSQEGVTREMRIENALLRSGLAMAGANKRDGGGGEDGILTALEATGLDLWGTGLVTLSACETGVGEVKTGDGVYGLRRALVIAGAETQMMSLWRVNDIGTRDLMIEYYRQLKSGAGRSQALRNVQLRMLAAARYSHPFYWASFIQSGDWRGIRMERGRMK